ncbi:DNA primase [Candidatus Cardinium hertigii]|uniref:DNA primase n=1 Tax=Candidatus Cardinium hertigii TaxID=247481 RepID=A0A2Z3LDN1_9BACT|nr:DNA primase [Candidatus Cardinium hertigii]AWN81876.1 DNA primase [Candidatus Cardinium hertigii]
MLLSQETIIAVQNRVCIEEVIADFIPLKKKGQNLWACCPFHQEHTPSFAVSPSKGFYKCFGCDAAGDAITFVQQIEHCSFVEAITYLAQKYGIALIPADNNKEERPTAATNEKIYAALNLAKAYFSELLWSHSEAAQVALPYLTQRDISITLAKKFSLGYSLNSWDGFYSFALAQGSNVETLLSAGLISQSDGKIYDRFRGRLLFPIANSNGQVVAFGARALLPTPATDSPKYLNSPETVVYHKRTILYGLTWAKQPVKQANHCYLVEGYTDVLAFHKIGKEAVVALSGTALSEEQIHTLRRLTSKLTLVFDGDQAGKQAAFRNIDPLLSKGFEVNIVPLPATMDPDSYIRTIGAAAFIDYLANAAQDFITFKADMLHTRETSLTPTEEAKNIRAIIQSILAIPDAIEQSIFLKKCSKLFSIDPSILQVTYDALRHLPAKTTVGITQRKKMERPYSVQKTYSDRKHIPFVHKLTASIEAYEQEIMRMLILYGSTTVIEGKALYEYIFLELGDIVFRSEKCQTLLAYYKERLGKGEPIDRQAILAQGDPAMQKRVIDLIACRHEISEAWATKYGIYTVKEVDFLYQATIEVIIRLKLRLVQALIEENRVTLTQACSESQEEELLQIHQMLKATECNLAKRLGIVVAQ